MPMKYIKVLPVSQRDADMLDNLLPHHKRPICQGWYLAPHLSGQMAARSTPQDLGPVQALGIIMVAMEWFYLDSSGKTAPHPKPGDTFTCYQVAVPGYQTPNGDVWVVADSHQLGQIHTGCPIDSVMGDSEFWVDSPVT